MGIASLSDMKHDAVVVATGESEEAFGLLEGMDPQSFGTTQPGAFIIGNMLGTTPVDDIEQGRNAAFSVEKHLKVGAMDGMPETFRKTRCAFMMDPARIERRAAVVPKRRGVYDEQEATAEAGRCLLCDCTVCSDGCELFDAFRRMTRQMVSDVFASLNTRRSAGMTQAISSRNLCSLCARSFSEHRGLAMSQMRAGLLLRGARERQDQ